MLIIAFVNNTTFQLATFVRKFPLFYSFTFFECKALSNRIGHVEKRNHNTVDDKWMKEISDTVKPHACSKTI